MNPLTSIYGAVSRTRNEFYDRGVLSVRRLQGPVVSIGNLAAGGSGKTPFVIALGEMLRRRGVSFDVLSRGYGRKTRGVALVNPDGASSEFGDEPLLIARKLGASVVIGEDRYAAGRFAEENFGPRLHLLDDGFQHRALARDFDIVMVNASDLQDRIFPMGRLREPLAALARADAIVLTNDMSAEKLPLVHQAVWRVRRDIVAPPVDEPCVAFCGIARPGNFFAQLRATSMNLAATRSFGDHHSYTRSDIRTLLALRAKAGATCFVTTEKDAINLDAHLDKLAPVYAVPVYMQIEDANTVARTLWSAIAARNFASA
ncbi:MAG TPA: tetraacyldisaccharide 4'-kinase [Terriglobales bacterium]